MDAPFCATTTATTTITSSPSPLSSSSKTSKSVLIEMETSKQASEGSTGSCRRLKLDTMGEKANCTRTHPNGLESTKTRNQKQKQRHRNLLVVFLSAYCLLPLLLLPLAHIQAAVVRPTIFSDLSPDQASAQQQPQQQQQQQQVAPGQQLAQSQQQQQQQQQPQSIPGNHHLHHQTPGKHLDESNSSLHSASLQSSIALELHFRSMNSTLFPPLPARSGPASPSRVPLGPVVLLSLSLLLAIVFGFATPATAQTTRDGQQQ